MKLKDLPKYLKTIKPWRSVLLLGPPGIGKSTTVREFAEAEAKQLGLEFVDYDYTMFNDIVKEPQKYYIFFDLRLTEVEPTDLGGIPRDLNENVIANKQYDWAFVFTRVGHGLLFLDEFNLHQRPDVESQSYKLVLDRKCGSMKFSKNVRLIAAGNTKDTNPIVRLLSPGLRNRFSIITVDTPTIEEWVEWMDSHVVHYDRRVIAYLKKFSDDFLKPPTHEVDGEENWPSPRTWHWLSEELPETPKEFWLEKSTSYLGSEVGGRFTAFLNTPVPEPEEILDNPNLLKELSMDAKYIAMVILANYYANTTRNVLTKLLAVLDVAASVSLSDLIIVFLLALQQNRKRRDEVLSEIIRNKSSPTYRALIDIGMYSALL